VYSEVNQKITKTAGFKFWFEYVYSFTNSQDYLINWEPSIYVMISQILSFKAAYLFKYQNPLAPNLSVRLDTTFTTALVAKF